MSLLHQVCAGSLIAACAMAGCRSEADSGPPSVRYGDSICAECGMIVSDERFATSTVIEGDRGDEPLIFDDFNCQMIFESKHGDLVVVDRWSHDYNSREWLTMSQAWFVKSDQLHTPMASNIAAFSTKDQAESIADPLGGEVVDFQTLWKWD